MFETFSLSLRQLFSELEEECEIISSQVQTIEKYLHQLSGYSQTQETSYLTPTSVWMFEKPSKCSPKRLSNDAYKGLF